MLSTRIQRRVPSAQSLGCVALSGFRLCCNKRSHDGSSKFNMVTSTEDSVYGVLFCMNKSDLPYLDEAEGLGYGYERVQRSLRYKQKNVEAFFYLAQPEYLCRDEYPYRWYLNFAIAGAIEHVLPEYYCQKLYSWPCKEDQQQARRVQNSEIIQASGIILPGG